MPGNKEHAGPNVAQFGKHERLERLAAKVDIPVILDLLTTLFMARNDVETCERLARGIAFVVAKSPWRRPLGVETMSRELLCPRWDSELLSKKIVKAVVEVPLASRACAYYRHYAQLSSEQLLRRCNMLINEKSVREDVKLGTHAIGRYLEICSGLLQLAEENRATILSKGTGSTAERSAVWLSFLASGPKVNGVLRGLSAIGRKARVMTLPEIPILEVGDGIWLLSPELIRTSVLAASQTVLCRATSNRVGNVDGTPRVDAQSAVPWMCLSHFSGACPVSPWPGVPYGVHVLRDASCADEQRENQLL